METVHFLGLKQYAARKVEKGLQYVYCYAGTVSGDAFARHIVASTGLHSIKNLDTDPRWSMGRVPVPRDAYWSQWAMGFRSICESNHHSGFWSQWHYAGDCGLDRPEGEEPFGNYVLCVTELLREGIVIDTSPQKVEARRSLPWDFDEFDDFDHFYYDD